MTKKAYTKGLTIDVINEYFKFHKKQVPNPPDKEIQGWILHFINREDFNSILVNYGIRYLLIVLDIFENSDKFKTCDKILTLINNYNTYYDKGYPTHISNLKPQR